MGITVVRTQYLQPSGWPDESNTGVPAGTSLTPSGTVTTSSNGQVVQDLDITGGVVINHANVIVRRCRITSTGSRCIEITGAADNALIEDCELDGENTAGIHGVGWTAGPTTGVDCLRLNVHSVENGWDCDGNADIRDCYIHDLDPGGADPHTDGFQCTAGSSNCNLIHNHWKLDTGGNLNGAIQFDVFTLGQFNWLIENNRIIMASAGPSAGGYSFRLPVGDATANNIRVVNNFITTGNFGYVTPTPPEDHITEWSGNVDAFTGAPVF